MHVTAVGKNRLLTTPCCNLFHHFDTMMKPELIPAVFCGLLWLLPAVAGTTTTMSTTSLPATSPYATTPTTPTTPTTTTTSTTTTSTSAPTSSSGPGLPSSGSDNDDGLGRGIGIGIGIALGVVALAVVAVTYFLWRRQWRLDLAGLCHGGIASHKHHDSEQHLEKPADSPNGREKVYVKPPKETPAAHGEAMPPRTEDTASGHAQRPGDDQTSRHSNMYEAPNAAYDCNEKYEPLSCQGGDERQSLTYEDPGKTSHNSPHSHSHHPHKIPKDKAEKTEAIASLPERCPPDGGVGGPGEATDDDFYVNYDETTRNDRAGGGDAVVGVRGQGMSAAADAAAVSAPVTAASPARHVTHPDNIYMPMDGTGHGELRPPSSDVVYMNYDAQSRV